MPAAFFPWVKPQFCHGAGNPVASGKLYSFVAGPTRRSRRIRCRSRPRRQREPALLNAAGQSATNIYLLPTGYKYRLSGAKDVTLWTVDVVEDVGAVFAAGLGVALTAGGKKVSSGYTVLRDRPADHRRVHGRGESVRDQPVARGRRDAGARDQEHRDRRAQRRAERERQSGRRERAYAVPVAASPLQPTIWLAPTASRLVHPRESRAVGRCAGSSCGSSPTRATASCATRRASRISSIGRTC